MFRLICKSKSKSKTIALFLERQRSIIDLNVNVNYVRYHLHSLPKPCDQQQQSLAVSFLTNSCGLSLVEAISASKMVNIQNTENPKSVIELLTSHGFNKSQIATLISKHPRLLLASPRKTLKPKIDYFESMGISGPHLPKFLCSNTNILLTSLKNKIMPTTEFLKEFFQDNQKLARALEKSAGVICCNIEKRVVPNINTLRAHGVPDPLVVRLIALHSNSLLVRVDLFRNVVEMVKEMGFEPSNGSFILAVRSMTLMSKTWEKKRDILRSFGWSEGEFNLAFRRQPMFLTCSEKKIRNMMHFYVNKAGLKPSDVVRCPNLLLVSLEKRIMPRWSVLKVLTSKSLLKKNVDLISALNIRKLDFEKRFLTSYMDDSEVITAYRRALGVHEVIADCKGCVDEGDPKLSKT